MRLQPRPQCPAASGAESRVRDHRTGEPGGEQAAQSPALLISGTHALAEILNRRTDGELDELELDNEGERA
jgi:hypothetical protein